MKDYYRPITCVDALTSSEQLAGGWTRFASAERITRDGSQIVPISEIPAAWMERLTAPRAPFGSVDMSTPQVMGILNVTPDSFSDGGRFRDFTTAMAQARAMQSHGASIIDVGGESTRPGAEEVPVDEEIARVVPIISELRSQSDIAISVDTRKSAVGAAAITAGASIINDVSAFEWDATLADVTATSGLLVCLMHAQGDPQTMQADPKYDHVLLDVYDYLERRVAFAESKGIPRSRIMVDPGIGFGKTVQHNISLIRGISLFHGLGCPILLGVSRKRFIGVIGGADSATERLGGSVSVALWGVTQGVQVVRVHDTFETVQAIKLQQAILGQ